jgi:hypothetical protein
MNQSPRYFAVAAATVLACAASVGILIGLLANSSRCDDRCADVGVSN